MDNLSRVIRKHRQRLGITQAQLAARAGLSEATVRNLESGRHEPTIHTANLLAAALGIDVAEIVKE